MLGIIPSWQFNTDANTNPLLNPHVQYPPGMSQTTVQPVGPYYNSHLQGLSFQTIPWRALLIGAALVGAGYWYGKRR